MRILVSGGGTGGHVFPAISIANAIKAKHPNAEFFFIGAKGKIEMEKVPKAGYPIEGLWISGVDRKITLRNLVFPFKLISSLVKSFFLIRKFKPQVGVGVGGYASGPALKMASWMGVPIVLQEANSFPGITNRLLGSNAAKVCVAYDNMERFFDKRKLEITGNPIRQQIVDLKVSKIEAAEHFNFKADKPTVFITGGSGGAKAINEGIASGYKALLESGMQIIWQTGKVYLEEYKHLEKGFEDQLLITDFITRMDCAYTLADVIVSRAGGTIAELSIIGKPAILLPSAYVTEDHQTKNVMALVEKDAAVLVRDSESKEKLCKEIQDLMNNAERRKSLSENIKALAKPNAANDIAEIVLKHLKK